MYLLEKWCGAPKFTSNKKLLECLSTKDVFDLKHQIYKRRVIISGYLLNGYHNRICTNYNCWMYKNCQSCSCKLWGRNWNRALSTGVSRAAHIPASPKTIADNQQPLVLYYVIFLNLNFCFKFSLVTVKRKMIFLVTYQV